MERAGFHPSDPPALVEASLACPTCLHAVNWAFAGRGAQPIVKCRCRGCGHTRDVELTGAQALCLAVLDNDVMLARVPRGAQRPLPRRRAPSAR